VESFFNGLQRFGVGRLTAILGAVGGVAAVMAAIILHVAAQPQALLYSNLDLKEASQIAQTLDQAGIKYESKGDGSTIMVNRDEVAKARMMLASKGLPTAASVGYEIFDKAPTLGQTEFVQNLDNQRALEGELARTINTLSGISSTRVHLVMPKRDLFSDEAAQPTASVVVGLSGGDLSPDSVRAIRNLVAGAVPNLKAENVTLVDERGHLLAAGGDGSDALDAASQAQKNQVEDALKKRITDIVEGVVGRGAARVMVSADVDQSSTTKEQVEYNPDGQVVRSTSTNSNSETSSDPNAGGATTASANIPGTQAAPTIPTTGNNSKQDSEVTNYEISTTKTTTVTGPGQIKKLAVSVAVDDIAVPPKDGKGATTYQKRSAADIQNIHDLVANAIAAYAQPGDPDPVKVVNISFNHDVDVGEGTLAKKSLFDFDKNDLMRGAEMVVLLVVALLTLFLVARPLLKFIGTQPSMIAVAGPNGQMQMMSAALAGAGAAGGNAAIADAGGGFPAISGGGGQLAPVVTGDERIDIARIEGQVRASSVKKVSEFVERHPEESVSILRSWLHDG
jgi:flagellar M-ring protein FliF